MEIIIVRGITKYLSSAYSRADAIIFLIEWRNFHCWKLIYSYSRSIRDSGQTVNNEESIYSNSKNFIRGNIGECSIHNSFYYRLGFFLRDYMLIYYMSFPTVTLNNYGKFMQIEHDPIADAIYIRLQDGEYYDTLSLGKYIHVDVGEKGFPLGIEILYASKVLAGQDLTNVTINQAMSGLYTDSLVAPQFVS